MNSTDLTRLKSSITEDYSRDGMLETLFGLALLFGGFNLIEKGAIMVWIAPILIVLLGRAWKRRITYPRLGYAEIYTRQKEERRKTMIFVLLAAVLVLAIAAVGFMVKNGTLAGHNILYQPYTRYVFGAFLCVFIAGVGVVQKSPHFYVLAAVLVPLIFATDRLHLSAGYALALTGGIGLIVGLIRLILFMRSSPRIEGDAARDPGR